MPSFYTSPVADSKITTLREFMRHCAPGLFYDGTLPEPATVNADRVRDLEKELERLQAMTIAEAEIEAQKLYDLFKSSAENSLNSVRQLRVTYEKMLANVRMWEPPDNIYCTKLRADMLRYLQSSIEHDCSEKYYIRELAELERISGAQWLARHIKWTSEDLVRAREELRTEAIEVAKKNEFLRLLAEIK